MQLRRGICSGFYRSGQSMQLHPRGVQDPIVVRIKWGSAAVGHAVILSGYFTDSDGEHWLLVKDPSGGTTALWTYDEFSTAYKGNGTWDITRRTKD